MLLTFRLSSSRHIAKLIPAILLILAGCTHPLEDELTAGSDPLPNPETGSIQVNLTASTDKTAKINLTWDAQTDHATYRILRTSALASSDLPQTPAYKVVGETKELFFSDTNVVPKASYYYKVQIQYSATNVMDSYPALGIAQDLSEGDAAYEAAFKAYTSLANATGGKRYDVAGASFLPETIIKIIQENRGGSNADIVLLMDNTGSMADDIDAVKKAFTKIIDALPPSTRLGAGGYRDRGDLYVLRFQDLTTNFSIVRTFINKMTANGGGDLPEAVYDAIYGTVTQATWVNKKRIVIVVGDAPPQEEALTDHSYQEVVNKCRQVGVEVNLYPILIKEPELDDKYGNG